MTEESTDISQAIKGSKVTSPGVAIMYFKASFMGSDHSASFQITLFLQSHTL